MALAATGLCWALLCCCCSGAPVAPRAPAGAESFEQFERAEGLSQPLPSDTLPARGGGPSAAAPRGRGAAAAQAAALLPSIGASGAKLISFTVADDDVGGFPRAAAGSCPPHAARHRQQQGPADWRYSEACVCKEGYKAHAVSTGGGGASSGSRGAAKELRACLPAYLYRLPGVLWLQPAGLEWLYGYGSGSGGIGGIGGIVARDG